MAKLFSIESDKKTYEDQNDQLRDEVSNDNKDIDFEVRDFSTEEYDFDIYNNSIDNAVTTFELAQESIDLLDRQDLNSKNYLIVYDNASRYFKSIAKNLNSDVVIPSMESIAISRTRKDIHKISMEGFMDVVQSIWEKIKSFFSALWKKIVLFFKRLVGAEPDFENLNSYIEKGLRDIEKNNKVCSNPSAKVETLLPMYLASPDSKEYTVDQLFTSGENKIKNFRLIFDEVDLKIEQTINQFKNKNAGYVNVLRETITAEKNLASRLTELLNNLREGLKLEKPNSNSDDDRGKAIINNIIKIRTAIEAFTNASEAINGNKHDYSNIAELITLLSSRPEDIIGSFGLTRVDPNSLPYTQLHDLVNEMKNNSSVRNVNCAAKYQMNGGNFATNNVSNLNIVFISTEPAIENNINEITDNLLDNFSFDMDLRVFKYPNEYVAKNMTVLSKKQDLTRAHNLYKIVKDFNVDRLKNSFIKLETANNDVDKLMDEVVKELRALIKFNDEFIELFKTAHHYLASLLNESMITDETRGNINAQLELLSQYIGLSAETKSQFRKIEIFYVKAAKHMKNSISQLGSNVAKDLSEIRYNLLKELGYYIYRSIKTYS